MKYQSIKIAEDSFNANKTQFSSIFHTGEVCTLAQGESDHEGEKPLLDSLLDSANICSPDMSKVKSVYRFPKLELSQDKMGIVKDKYGTKVTRKREEADLWIISQKYLSTLTTDLWRLELISIPDAITFFNLFRDKSLAPEAVDNIIEYINTIDPSYYLSISVPSWSRGGNVDADTLHTYWRSKVVSYSRPSIMSASCLDIYEDLQNNQHKLVSDIVMNDITSEDSVALDFKSYNQIHSMIESSDVNDVAIAMNLMSNCKIKDSHTWLGILFYDHTYGIRSQKLWNQVAFKTLKTKFKRYIDYSANNSYHTPGPQRINTLVGLLYNDGALVPEAVELMKDRMCKTVNDYMSHGGYSRIEDKIRFKYKREDIKLEGRKPKSTVKGDFVSHV